MVEGLPECVIAVTKESCRYHKSKVSMRVGGDHRAAPNALWAGLRGGARYAGPCSADRPGSEEREPASQHGRCAARGYAMLKTARLVPLLLTAWVASAAAADCLQQIDNITVEFDLPAAENMAGTQTGSAYYVPPPPNQTITVPPPPTTTPPGRPGAPRGPVAGGSPGTAPVVSSHDRLTAAQRTKLVAILRQARSAEALGNEPKCFELLREAQAVTKGNG